MTIIVVGSCKGGSGKTTTCVNLSVGIARRGSEVVLVDADNQGTANRWSGRREDHDHTPLVTVIRKSGNLVKALESLNQKYGYVVVDVGSSNSGELISAMAVADHLIAPYACCEFDVESAEELRDLWQNSRMLNPELKVLVYQSMAETNPILKDQERVDFIEYMERFPEFHLLESVAHRRKVYKDVQKTGSSVVEARNHLAIEEINSLLKEVLNV